MRYFIAMSVVALSTIIAGGCGESDSSSYRSTEAPVAVTPAVPLANAPGHVAVAERKHIRTARLEMRADDLTEATSHIEEVTSNLGGYVSSKETHTHEIRGFILLTLRVPNDKLELLLKGIHAAATVDDESISTQEVTEQFIDLNARLQTLMMTETEIKRLLEESRERKATVENIMAIHQRMMEVRSQIESTQGKLNVLSQQSELATVHLTVTHVETAAPIVSKVWRPWETVHASVRFLVNILQVLADVLIVVAIDVIPLMIIFGGPAWIVASVMKRKRQRMGA